MPPNDDPYLYPGTTTLKNKLGIRDPDALGRVQDERAAARYAILERNLPQPPFTFETLKDVHRQLFGTVYEWAGQPRTIGIQKADWDDAGGTLTIFANPAMIAAVAGVAFKAIDNGRALMELDRPTFATRAAEFLNDLNIIHPFRVMLNCKGSHSFGRYGCFRPRLCENVVPQRQLAMALLLSAAG